MGTVYAQVRVYCFDGLGERKNFELRGMTPQREMKALELSRAGETISVIRREVGKIKPIGKSTVTITALDGTGEVKQFNKKSCSFQKNSTTAAAVGGAIMFARAKAMGATDNRKERPVRTPTFVATDEVVSEALRDVERDFLAFLEKRNPSEEDVVKLISVDDFRPKVSSKSSSRRSRA